ncbi:MAG: molybdopterin-dependent oxidoreductase [Spirochaetia bacterium]|nr:molybdopterin-dependent oxidoreductase [Spirochaetia bacterium]
MLYASTIRSPYHRGKQAKVFIDTLPKGFSMILAEDLARHSLSSCFKEGIPLFASEQISYRGEALGLILGPDPGICDELAASTRVECEEEEPEQEWESFSSSQIAYHHSAEYGNLDKMFAAAATELKEVYRNGIFDHHYGEPMGALALWDKTRLSIHCATQWPDDLRRRLAGALSVPENDIIVYPTEMGRTLDGRLWYPSIVAAQAAVASKISGKPVRILYTREEDFLHTTKQARSAVSIRSGSDDQGKLLALDIVILINIGAYNPLAPELVYQAVSAITGIYSCPAIRIEAYAIRSNTIPLGAMGGVGATHAFFAIEAHMNNLAQRYAKHPAEIKALNILKKGQSTFGAPGLNADIPFGRIHRELEQISDYPRKYASYELVKKRDPGCREGIVRGIALTLGYQTGRSFSEQAGTNTYSVEATLDRELKLTIKTQAAIGSEALKTMWRKAAAEILSIQEDHIQFLLPENTHSLPSGPLTLSRGSTLIEYLIEKTCRSIQKKRFRESLPINAKARTRALKASTSPEGLFSGAQLFDSASWCGTAVEVEIDALTGKPIPLAVWMVIDAGRIICRQTALASLRASVLSALALCTANDFDPASAGRKDYLADSGIRMRELPRIDIEFIEPDRNQAAKGIGELPFITIPAAFYSALTQALGLDPRQLPLKGGEILRLLEG